MDAAATMQGSSLSTSAAGGTIVAPGAVDIQSKCRRTHFRTTKSKAQSRNTPHTLSVGAESSDNVESSACSCCPAACYPQLKTHCLSKARVEEDPRPATALDCYRQRHLSPHGSNSTPKCLCRGRATSMLGFQLKIKLLSSLKFKFWCYWIIVHSWWFEVRAD